MRYLPLLLLLGCGRLSFDPLTSSSNDAGDDTQTVFKDADTVPGAMQVLLSATGECPALALGQSGIGVTWREGGFTGTTDVMFALFDNDGTIVQGPFVAAGGLDNVDCPAIAATGADFRLAISNGPINQHVIDFVTVVGGAAPSAPFSAITGGSDKVAPKLAILSSMAVLTWLDKQGASQQVLVLAVPLGGGTPNVYPASGLVMVNGPPSIGFINGFIVTWSAGDRPRMRQLDTSGSAVAAERLLADVSAAGLVGIAPLGVGSTFIAWVDSLGDTLTTAEMTETGALVAPPKFHTAARARQPAVMFSGVDSGGGVAYLETFGLVQVHLATLDGDALVTSDTPVMSATTTSTTSLTWTGDRYAAALQAGTGAFLKFFPSP